MLVQIEVVCIRSDSISYLAGKLSGAENLTMVRLHGQENSLEFWRQDSVSKTYDAVYGILRSEGTIFLTVFSCRFICRFAYGTDPKSNDRSDIIMKRSHSFLRAVSESTKRAMRNIRRDAEKLESRVRSYLDRRAH